MEFEKELQCPRCRTNSLIDIGDWDDENLFKCVSCRYWFLESYIRGKNNDALCLHEVPIGDLK
jgi:transposase-like protein